MTTTITPLFISYFYPPAGGNALPGAQRSVKFVRYLCNSNSSYVLTLRPECYQKNILLDFNIPLPVNRETIIRTDLQDRFLKIMYFRERIGRLFNNKQHLGIYANKNNIQSSRSSNELDYTSKGNLTLNQKIKDSIFNLYYFPDQIAAPWLKPAVKAGVKLIHEKKINIIFATGMPWTALVVGRLISRKTGVPFIADFRDPWRGNPFLLSKGMLLDWREQLCERKIIENAALVTANTEPLREEFLSRYPNISPEKIITLTNGFDPYDFRQLATTRVAHKKMILMHAGFLYGKRDPAPLLSALELLHSQNPELKSLIEFQQIGGVSFEYDIKHRFGGLIKNGLFKIIGQLPYKECLDRLAEADVLVIIQPGTKTQVPSKLYDYLCINRPIITISSYDSALGKLIKDYQFGELFAPNEQQRLMEKLVHLCKMKSEGKHISADYPNREIFNVRKIAQCLEEKMAQIVSATADK